MVLILSYVIRFKLSGVALSHLLKLIQLLIPKNNNLPSSSYLFKKIFKDLTPDVVTHYYCSLCLLPCKEGVEHCENSACKYNEAVMKQSYFIEFPLKDQIKTIVQRGENLKKIRTSKQIQNDLTISDIKDGSLHKSLSEPGQFLSASDTISFTWNTDGVPVFKSSKMSIWPLFLEINELPYKERIHHDNMIISGVWYGDSHPNMNTYLLPLMEKITAFETSGVNIIVDGEEVEVRGTLLCGSCDMPAKAIALNMKQFNSFFGCPKCLQPGENFRTLAGGNVHIFPVNVDNPSGPNRTNESMINDAMEAVRTGKPINGVKGPTALYLAKNYDVIKGTSVDYMHGVLLGVMKTLMKLWFDKAHNKEEYSCYSKITEIDQRIQKLSPSNAINRMPRKIDKNLCHWKASEFRSWLLYFSIPVISGILPDAYFQHFLLLSQAIHLLLKDKITQVDIDVATNLILIYCFNFEKLYSARYQTINFHSLIHLPSTVLELGPLWTYSLFNFEDMNGFILTLFHGTQNVPFQIASAVSSIQKLPELREKYIVGGSEEDIFLDMCKRKESRDNFFNITDTIDGFGLRKSFVLPDTHFVATDFFDLLTCSYKQFRGIMVHKYRILAKECSKEQRRNSSVVQFLTGTVSRYFLVDYFLECTPLCSCGAFDFACLCSKNKSYVAVGHEFLVTKHLQLNNYNHLLG